jgi:transposase
MYVKSTKVRSGNKSYEYLSLVEGYRDEAGKVRQRTLFRLGEASRLRESGELDRIIEALTTHAERRFIDADDITAEDAPAIGGIAAVKAWWDKLGLGGFFDAAGRRLSWSLADAVFAMTANRLLDPASKRKTVRWIEADVVAPEGFSFPTLEQYYRVLDRVHDLKSELETFLYSRLTDLTNLTLTLVCFDLTSTYLEGSVAPSVKFPSKAFGHSRDKRGDRPQVVVGLLMTGDGIPIAHQVFAGDTSDVTTLPGVLEGLQQRFGVGRICLVADRGLISETNIATVEGAGYDWLIATKLRNRTDVTKVIQLAHAADDDDWVQVDRFNSKVLDLDHDGRRYVVVFSEVREHRDTVRRLQLIKKVEDRLLALERRIDRGDITDRDEMIAAAEKILARSPVRRLFTYTISHGRLVYDYDHDALDYDEALAGHYILATSLPRDTHDAAEVLACYRTLAKIEALFRVLKDFLQLRPIRHWTETRVRGHIAACVLACVIEALMAKTLTEADVRDPDLDDQHLTPRRALEELERIRQVTLTPGGGPTLEVVTRRSAHQQQILDALEVDTRHWQRPTIAG